MEKSASTRFPWLLYVAIYGLLCCIGLVLMSGKSTKESETSLPILKISFPEEKHVRK